jgi:hypothetical protein
MPLSNNPVPQRAARPGMIDHHEVSNLSLLRERIWETIQYCGLSPPLSPK